MRKRYLNCCFLALFVAGCGGSSAPPAPTATPTPRPTPNTAAHVGPIPQTTPPPVKHRSRASKAGKGSIHTLPTTPPVTARPTSPPAAVYNAVLQGTVTDAKSHSPLAGAMVLLGDGRHHARTNAFGTYRVAFPGGFMYTVRVTMSGYLGALAMGRVPAHQALRLNFALVRAGKGQAPAPPSIFGTPGSAP